MGDVGVVSTLVLARQWPVEPGLFQGCGVLRGFPLLPVAACPYPICATLAQGSKQSGMLHPAPHQAYAVSAPAIPVSGLCPLLVSRGACAGTASVDDVSLGLRDLEVEGLPLEVDGAEVDRVGDVEG